MDEGLDKMVDILQFRKVNELRYQLGQGEMKILMVGTTDNYFSYVDEVEINTKDINMNSFEINDNVVTMKFSKPIICNVNTGRYNSHMKCGVELEGKEKNSLVERLESLSDKINIFKDDSITKMKEKIQSQDDKENE